MLSNSSPKNNDPYDDFFGGLCRNFNIERIAAKQFIKSINSKGESW